MPYDYRGFRDRLKKEYEYGQASGDAFVLKDRAIVRILPYADKKGEPCLFKESPVHFGLAKFPVACGQGAPHGCLICETAKAAGASGDPDEAKWAQSVSQRRRFLFNIVNMEVPAEQRRVQVLSAPYSLKQAILSFYTDPEFERALFLEGRDFILTKKGTGLDTEYSAKVRMDASDIDPVLAEEVFDLDEYTQIDDAETMAGYLGYRASGQESVAPPPRQGAMPRPPSAAPQEAAPAPRRPASAPALPKRAAPAPAPEEEAFPSEEGVYDPVTGEPLDTRPVPPTPRRPASPAPLRRAPAAGRRR